MPPVSLARVATWAIVIGLTTFAGACLRPEPHPRVWGGASCSRGQNWSESDSRFTPSSPGHNATVDFPAAKWSALIGTLPLKDLDGSFTTHVRCRWITDLTTIKGASATVQFMDADGHDMPGAGNVAIPVAPGWQDVDRHGEGPERGDHAPLRH